jgi:filamentous hemagglutinin
MALKPLLSDGGFGISNSSSNTSTTVIYANTDISGGNINVGDQLSVTGNSILGAIGNVKITGGANGQVIQTDGNGNLTFGSSGGFGNLVAPMPTFIASDESYLVSSNHQGLFGTPITIDGEMVIDGVLVEVDGITGTSNGQIIFNDMDVTTGNANLTFDKANATITTGGINLSRASNLGDVANLTITGGSSGQYLQTDGTGNLAWAAGGGGGGGSPGGVNTQVQFNDAGSFAGNTGFTFNKTTGTLGVPNVAVTGNIIPTANVTYSLGNDTNRFSNLYLSGSTIILGNSTISANSTSVVITNPQGGKFVMAGTGDANSSSLVNGNSNIRIAANSSIGLSANGVSNVLLVTKDGGQFTGNLGTTGNITSLLDISALGNISGVDLTATGNLNVTGNASAGNFSITGSFEASGNLSGTNINTSGDLAVIGNANISTNASISGNAVVGSRLTVGNPLGTYKTDLYSNGYAGLANLAVSGNISGGNVSLSSNLSVTGTANIGTLNVSSVNTLGNVNAANVIATGNISADNANLGNLVVANFFQGDGHLLSNITVEGGTSIVNGNSNVAVAPNANVTLSANGVANVVVVTGTNTIFDSDVTVNQNINVSGSVNSPVLQSGNSSITLDGASGTWIAFDASAGNVVVMHDTGMNVFGYSNVTGNSSVSGNLTTSNLSVSGNSTLNTVTVNGLLQSSANIEAGNIDGGNLVTANFLAGDGYLISNLTIAGGSSIINGNSNVNIAPNANVTITAEGNANVVTVTGNSVIFDKQISGPLANFTVANIPTLYASSLSVQNALNVNASVTANGSLNANTLNINADPSNNIYGSGSFDGNLYVGTYLFVAGYSNLHTINATSLNISGSIDANATVHGNYITATFDISASRNVNVDDTLTVNGNSVLHRTTVNGNLTADNIDGGNLVTANYLSGDGYLLSNLTIPAGTYLINGTSNLYVDGSGNVRTSVDGTANVMVVTSTGANITGTLNASGNANTNNLGTGRILATGNITASALISNGNISGTNITASGNASVTGTASVTGNISAGNASLGNLVTANFFQGDGYLLSNLTVGAGSSINNGSSNVLVTNNSNVNITVNGTANVVQVTEANVIVNGDLRSTGSVTAASFANGSSNIAITENGPVGISINGVDSVFNILGTGVYSNVKLYAQQGLSVAGNSNIGNLGLSGIITTPSDISARDYDASGNLTVGGNANLTTARVSGSLTTIGNVSAGNIFTAGVSNVGTLYVGSGGANINGTTTITGNIDVTGNFNVTGNLNYSNVTDLNVGDPLIYIGDSNPGDSYDLGLVASYVISTQHQHTGIARNHTNSTWTFFANVIAEPTTTIDWANATYAPVRTGNLTASKITTTGNVDASYFNGNVIGNITGNVTSPGSTTQVIFNDGGTMNANSGMTFTKATGALVISGNITGANLVTAGGLSATGNANTGNLGTGTAIITTGNITTINSGLLQNGNSNVTITANGNVTLNAVGGARVIATSSGANVTGTLGVSGNSNVGNLGTAGLIVATGNVTGGNLTTGGALSVTGNSNVGNIGTAGIITATGNVTSGNLNTAGQVVATGNGTFGNVTATAFVGNLSGSGNSNVANLGASGLIVATGNITGGNLVTAGAVSATGNVSGGNLTVTSNITAANLSVTGRSNLGAPANITITGGTSGYVLQTDGAGNLSWTAQSGGGGSANIPIYDEGNLLTSAVGSLNFVGAGVTATAVGNAVTVTIEGGGGAGGGSTTGYSSQTFVGNGVQNTATVTSGATSNSVLVAENGILQTPDTDYTVSGTTLTFSTPPASNTLVQIRELSAGGAINGIFYENDQTITANYTITSGKNAMTTGPVTINTGVTVTVPSGSRWVII